MLKKRWEYPMLSLLPVRIKDYGPVDDTGWQNSTNQSGLGRTVHKIAHRSLKGLPMILGLNRAGQMLSCLLSMAWKHVSFCSHSVLFDPLGCCLLSINYKENCHQPQLNLPLSPLQQHCVCLLLLGRPLSCLFGLILQSWVLIVSALLL